MNTEANSFTCRVCGQNEYSVVLDGLKTRLDETYSLVQCRSCTFISTFPLPSPEMLTRYYDADYWSPGEDSDSKTLMDTFFKLRMRKVTRFIERRFPHKEDVRALDWGAGDGAWVRLLREKKYNIVGIDLYSSPPAADFLINGDIRNVDLPDAPFDLITCFYVMEHLADPVESFKAAFEKLNRGGLMIIEVPHIDTWEFKFFRKKWYSLHIPTHLNHFSLATLNKVFQPVGKDKVEIIKNEFFSIKNSPSTLVVSTFPRLCPIRMRKKYNGRYPFIFKLLYLGLQMMAYPLSRFEGFMKKGSVMRLTLKKK